MFCSCNKHAALEREGLRENTTRASQRESKRTLLSWASAEIFPGRGNVDISLILFQVAHDVTQMGIHKTFCALSTSQRNFPKKARAPFAFFWNRIQVELCSSLRKGCAFCPPLQLLLNWGIIQCHYDWELQTTESELDFNYPQLRLWCSHWSVRAEPHFSKFSKPSEMLSFHKLLNIYFSSTFYK